MPGPVVGNQDFDGLGVPPRIQPPTVSRRAEVDGILQDVADAHRELPELRMPTGFAGRPATAMRTLMGDAENRGAARPISSIKVDRRHGGRTAPPVEDSCVILARMSRQRCACSRRVFRSPAEARLLSLPLTFPVRAKIRKNGREAAVPSSCAAASRRGPSNCVRCCSRVSTQFGGPPARSDNLRASSVTWERIQAGDADREPRSKARRRTDRSAGKFQGFVPPSQGNGRWKKTSADGAGNRGARAEAQMVRRIGSAVAEIRHRRQKNRKRERILQAAGEKTAVRASFGDIQPPNKCRGIGRASSPLHRIEGDLPAPD